MTSYNGDLVLVGGFLDGGNKNIESVVFENEVGTWEIVGQMNLEHPYQGMNIASWKQSMVTLNQYIYAFGGFHMYDASGYATSNLVLRINRRVTRFKNPFYTMDDISHVYMGLKM